MQRRKRVKDASTYQPDLCCFAARTLHCSCCRAPLISTAACLFACLMALRKARMLQRKLPLWPKKEKSGCVCQETNTLLGLKTYTHIHVLMRPIYLVNRHMSQLFQCTGCQSFHLAPLGRAITTPKYRQPQARCEKNKEKERRREVKGVLWCAACVCVCVCVLIRMSPLHDLCAPMLCAFPNHTLLP